MILTKLKENGNKVACNLEGKDLNIVDEIAYQFTQSERIIIYLFLSMCNL